MEISGLKLITRIVINQENQGGGGRIMGESKLQLMVANRLWFKDPTTTSEDPYISTSKQNIYPVELRKPVGEDPAPSSCFRLIPQLCRKRNDYS